MMGLGSFPSSIVCFLMLRSSTILLATGSPVSLFDEVSTSHSVASSLLPMVKHHKKRGLESVEVKLKLKGGKKEEAYTFRLEEKLVFMLGWVRVMLLIHCICTYCTGAGRAVTVDTLCLGWIENTRCCVAVEDFFVDGQFSLPFA